MNTKFVYQDETVVAFEDIKPKAPCHVIVIPRAHIEKTQDISKDNVDIIGRMMLCIPKIAAKKGISESGYRTVINCGKDAGQEVEHLHIHILGGRSFKWPPG